MENLNKLVEQVHCCFVCGALKFREFYSHGHLYRVCFNCLKRKNVQEFFSCTSS